MKILVTGGAGFIGSHVAEKFAKAGHDVIGIDNFSPYYARELKELNVEAIKKAGVKFFERDIVDDNLSDLLSGVEYVIHCAAQPGLEKNVPYKEYERNNVDATRKLLDYFVESKSLKSFIFTSTSSVYGLKADKREEEKPTPVSDYGRTKLDAEKVILEYYRNHNVPMCILRLFSVIGPRERPEKLYSKLIRSILEDEEFTLFSGSKEHIRSYTYVGDVVRAINLALSNLNKSIGEIFNIGGVEKITTKEGVNLVQELMGKKAKIKIVPSRPGDQLYTKANIDKVKKILGYKPQTSFKEAIEEQIEWYKNEVQGLNI